jgi:sugar phosphate isomerase/epimerase
MSRPRVGVCSWSLRCTAEDALAAAILETGVRAVQIALDPVRRGEMTVATILDRFERDGITLLSGMMAMDGEDYSTLASIRATGGIVPDATWPANLAAAGDNARIASELGLGLVTFHAGFVPESATNARAVVVDRVRSIAGVFAAHGIRVALETGQESAGTMLAFLDNLDDVSVNFDPANMILYGMGDPVQALKRLAPHVAQVHVKDAVASAEPGRWGTELPVGAGDIDWASFFAAVRTLPQSPALVVEREAGGDRIADVQTALRLIHSYVDGADD